MDPEPAYVKRMCAQLDFTSKTQRNRTFSRGRKTEAIEKELCATARSKQREWIVPAPYLQNFYRNAQHK